MNEINLVDCLTTLEYIFCPALDSVVMFNAMAYCKVASFGISCITNDDLWDLRTKLASEMQNALDRKYNTNIKLFQYMLNQVEYKQQLIIQDRTKYNLFIINECEVLLKTFPNTLPHKIESLVKQVPTIYGPNLKLLATERDLEELFSTTVDWNLFEQILGDVTGTPRFNTKGELYKEYSDFIKTALYNMVHNNKIVELLLPSERRDLLNIKGVVELFYHVYRDIYVNELHKILINWREE